MNNLYKYLIGGSFALGTFALIVSAPETAKNLKPLKNDRLQEIVDYQNKIFTDKESGTIYGWIEGAGGEWRFVKMDKNSENKVRQERQKSIEKIAREEAKEAGQYIPEPVPVSKNKNDVRSGEIFEVDEVYEGFEVNSRIKWRAREGQMLYRLSIKAPSIITSNDSTVKCISGDREDELASFILKEDNEIRLRFLDEDDFWLNDFVIPLGKKKANNNITTAIDTYYKDSCGNTNQFVFHGRLENFYLPDYSWVEDGKLLFSGVKISRDRNDEKLK
tara:strand:+ start:217 stop:1041 length:825 start_codon:yes stop_codon:yes gene_type:complete